MKASPEAATKTSPKNKISKKTLKMHVWCDRLGRSLASTWGGPFFDVHKVGAPVELQKCSKTFKNKWFGAFLGDPSWGTNLGEMRSHAAWHSFLVFRSVPMQRGVHFPFFGFQETI